MIAAPLIAGRLYLVRRQGCCCVVHASHPCEAIAAMARVAALPLYLTRQAA